MCSATILMVPPTFFSVEYAINPWMNPHTSINKALALAQWQGLKHTLITQCHADVLDCPAVEGLPDMVFVANAAVLLPAAAASGQKRVLLARFLNEERQKEEAAFQQWFEANGYLVEQFPSHLPFEGAGEALAWEGFWFASYGQRAVHHAHSWLAYYSGQPVISLELIDPQFYHLDVAFCPTDLGYVLYYPEAFSSDSLALLEAIIPAEKRLIVPQAEALQFACNAVSVGNHVVLPCDAPVLRQQLEATGHTVHTVAYSEFIKAGGATKCSTLRLAH